MNPTLENEFAQWKAKNPNEQIGMDQWVKIKQAAGQVPEPDLIQRGVAALSDASKTIARTPLDNPYTRSFGSGQGMRPEDMTPEAAKAREEQYNSEFPTTGFAGAMDKFVGQPAAEYITPGARAITRDISEGAPKLGAELITAAVAPQVGIPLFMADAGTSSYSAAKDAGLSTPEAGVVGGLGAGIAGLVPGAGKVGAEVAGKQLAKAGVENVLRQKAVEIGGSQLAMGGLMEGGRMLQEGMTTGKVTPITDPEIAFQTVLGQAPFMALDLPRLMGSGPTATQSARFEQVKSMYDSFMTDATQAYDKAAPLLASSEAVQAGLQSELTRKASFGNELTQMDKELLAPHYAWDKANNASEAQTRVRAEFEKAAGFDAPEFALAKGERDFSGPLPPNLALRAIIQGVVKPLSPSNIVQTSRARYDELQAQMAKTTPGTPDYQKLWQQSEDIKNKFGSMPPGETAAGEQPSTLGRGTSEETVQLIRDLQRHYSGSSIDPSEPHVNLQQNVDLAHAIREGLNVARKQLGDKVPVPRLLDFAVNNGTITPEQRVAWDAMGSQNIGDGVNTIRTGNKQEVAAWVLDFLTGRKELEGYSRTSGFDENSWAAQSAPNPNDLALSINLAAHDLHERLNPQNPVEVGQMIRTVNTFSQSVDAALRKAGVEPLMIQGQDIMRITPEKLQSSYRSAYSDYLYAPNEESAARTVEYVKGQLLIQAEMATKRLTEARMQNDSNLSANWDNLLAKDKAFGPAIQSLPRTVQKFIGKQYGRFAQEDNGRWALPGWMEKVTNTINKLTPEQRQQLAEVDSKMAAAELEAMQAEKFKQSVDAKRADTRLESRNVGDTSGDLPTTQKSLSEKALQDALSAIPVEREQTIKQRGKEGEKVTTASNLYRLLTQGGLKETIYGNDAAKAGSKELSVDQHEENLQDTISTLYDDLGSDAKVNELTGAANPVKDALGEPKAQTPQDSQAVETEAEIQARELQEGKALEDGNPANTEDVNVAKVANPEDAPSRTDALKQRLAESFDGTLENPIQKISRMSDIELEVLFDKYGVGNLAKQRQRLSTALGRPATKDETIEWVREFLLADPVGNVAGTNAGQVLNADFSPNQNAFREKYAGIFKDAKHWQNIRTSFFNRDPLKQALLRTELMGLTPKPGVNLSEVFGRSDKPTAMPKEKFIADARQTLATVFTEAGYQPAMVQALADLGVKMAEPFRWLTHASFAQLVDKKALTDQWDGRMFTLGTHIPSGSVVDGKLVKNPIVGLLVDQAALRWQYPRMASFLTLATWPHELFHLAVRELVERPDPNMKMNADTLAQAVALRKMLNTSAQLDVQERFRIAKEIADVTMPRNAVYDGPQLKGEIGAYLQRIASDPKEFAAYIYQMHSIGLAARLMEVPDSQGMVQWNRVAKDMSNQMMWLPDEMQTFLRSQFRTLGLFAESMQKTAPDMQRQVADTLGNKADRLTAAKQPPTAGTMETISALGKAAQEVTEAGTRASDTGYAATKNRLEQEVAANRQELQTRYGELTNGERYRLEKRIRSGEAQLAALKPDDNFQGPSSSLSEPVKQQPISLRAMWETVKAVARINEKYDQATTTIKQLANNMESGYVPDPSTTVQKIDVADLPNTSEMQNLPKSAQQAQDLFYDSLPPEKRQIFEQNWITRRLISPSFRMWDLSRRGVEEADRSYAALRSTPALTHKYISQMMTPISTRVGKLGEIGLDPAKAYVQFLEQAKNPSGSRMHDAFNKLIGKVQELKGLKEVTPAANSPLIPGQAKPAGWKRGDPILQHPEITKFAQQVMHFLPTDQQHLVATALDDYFATTKQMTDMELIQAGTTSKYLIGRRAMMMSKMTDSQQAVLVGQLALKATELNPVNINATIQADNQLRAMTEAGIINPKTLESVLAMGKISNEGLAKLQQNYDSMGHYAPESRSGDRLIWYTDANGERASVGADGKLDAIRKSQDLIKNHQATAVSVQLKSDMKESKALLSDYSGLGKVESFIARNFDAQINHLRSQGPEGIAAADELEASPHNPKLAFGAEQMTSALNDARMHRKLYPGREHLDYVRTLEDAVLHRGSAMARSDTRLVGDMTIQALENQGYKNVAQDMRIQLSEALAPTSNLVAQLNTAAAAYQMGGISANLLTEASQGLIAGLPVLRMEGVPYTKTWKTFINAANTTMGWMNQSPFYTGGKFKDLVKQYDPQNLKGNSKESTLAYHMQRFTDEGRLGVEQTVDVLKDAEVLALNQMQIGRKSQINWRNKETLLAGVGEAGSKGVAGLYAASKLWLTPFKFMTEANQRAFAYAALDVGYERGLRGDELQQYAAGLTDRLAMSGGGRANRQTGVTLLGANSPFARNALGTATLLQSYGANMTWMMMNAAKDALGGTKGLNPTQRKASRDAVLHMTAASLFMAGTLGVPGVGLALALFNKEDTARKAAKAFADLLPVDDAMANTFTEAAMNGVVNTSTGLDVGGRAAVSSFMGLGTNKLDLNSLGGVVPSTLSDISAGSKELANGEFLRALQYGGPRNIRAAAGLMKSYVDYGDGHLMDRQQNEIMKPTVAQQLGMVMGVTPAQVRTRRQKVDAVKTVNQKFNDQNSRELDRLAVLMLDKDPSKQRSVVPALVQLAARNGAHPKDLINTVYDRAVDMQIPTDPTREGNIGSSQDRREINASFGQPPPTEAARVQLKQSIAQALGHPFDSKMPFQREMENKKSLQKASAIDALMQQQHMTLQEARQYIEDTTR